MAMDTIAINGTSIEGNTLDAVERDEWMTMVKRKGLSEKTAASVAARFDALREGGYIPQDWTQEEAKQWCLLEMEAFFDRNHASDPEVKRMLYRDAIQWGVLGGTVVVNHLRDWSVRRDTPWDNLRLRNGYTGLEELLAREFSSPEEGPLLHCHLGSGDNRQVSHGNKDTQQMETHLGRKNRCEAWQQIGFGDKLYSSLDMLIHQFALPKKVDDAALAIIIRVLTEAVQHQLSLRWSGEDGIRDLNVIFEILADTKTLLADVHFPEAIPGTLATLELSGRFAGDQTVDLLAMDKRQDACLEAYQVLLRMAGEPTSIIDFEIWEMKKRNAHLGLENLIRFGRRVGKCRKAINGRTLLPKLIQEFRTLVPREMQHPAYGDIAELEAHTEKLIEASRETLERVKTKEQKTVNPAEAEAIRERTLRWLKKQLQETTDPFPSRKVLSLCTEIINGTVAKRLAREKPKRGSSSDDKAVDKLKFPSAWRKGLQSRELKLQQPVTPHMTTFELLERVNNELTLDEMPREEMLLLKMFGKRTIGDEPEDSFGRVAARSDRVAPFDLLSEYFDPTFVKAIRDHGQYSNDRESYRKRALFQANHHTLITPALLEATNGRYVRENIPRDAHIRLNGELLTGQRVECNGYNVIRDGTTLTITKNRGDGECVLEITAQLDLNNRPHAYPTNFILGQFGELSETIPPGTCKAATATRSDSHVQGDKAFQVHVEDVLRTLAPGGCYITDGLEQSYTQILRIADVNDRENFRVWIGVDTKNYNPAVLVIQRRHPRKGFLRPEQMGRVWDDSVEFVDPEGLATLRPDLEISNAVRKYLLDLFGSAEYFRSVQKPFTFGTGDKEGMTIVEQQVTAASASQLMLKNPTMIDGSFQRIVERLLHDRIQENQRPTLEHVAAKLCSFIQQQKTLAHIRPPRGDSIDEIRRCLAEIKALCTPAFPTVAVALTDETSPSVFPQSGDSPEDDDLHPSQRAGAMHLRMLAKAFESAGDNAEDALTTMLEGTGTYRELGALQYQEWGGCSLFEVAEQLSTHLAMTETTEAISLLERVLIDAMLTRMQEGNTAQAKPLSINQRRRMLLQEGRNVDRRAEPLLGQGDIQMVILAMKNTMRRIIESSTARATRKPSEMPPIPGRVTAFTRRDAASNDVLRERLPIKKSHWPHNSELVGPAAEERLIMKIDRIRALAREIRAKTDMKPILLLPIAACATNDILLEKLRMILGNDLFQTCVEQHKIEFTGTSEEPTISGLDRLEEHIASRIAKKNALVIGTGSLHNVFDAHGTLYLKRIAEPLFEASIRQRTNIHQVGICFHSQAMGHIAGEQLFGGQIGMVQGPLEMGLVPMSTTHDGRGHPLLEGCGQRTTVAMAHGSHLSGNFAAAPEMKILATSEQTGLPILWQLPQMTGIQAHLELSISTQDSRSWGDDTCVTPDIKHILWEAERNQGALAATYRHFSMPKLADNFNPDEAIDGDAIEILLNAAHYHLAEIMQDLV